jgi:hypothetical protein
LRRTRFIETPLCMYLRTASVRHTFMHTESLRCE